MASRGNRVEDEDLPIGLVVLHGYPDGVVVHEGRGADGVAEGGLPAQRARGRVSGVEPAVVGTDVDDPVGDGANLTRTLPSSFTGGVRFNPLAVVVVTVERRPRVGYVGVVESARAPQNLLNPSA